MKSIEKIIYSIALIIRISNIHCFLDPISIGAGAAAISATGFKFMKDYGYCQFVECCNDIYIPGDVKELKRELVNSLYGQHIVIDNLVPAIEAHFHATIKSQKPLVISFQGTPGTGKNYVADIIAKTLYKNGLQSKFVHKYFGKMDFNLKEKVDEYKERLTREVRDGIASCPRSLFIFDEVDRMAPGVFDSLASLVGYNTISDSNDNTNAIFIFMSNAAGTSIADELGSLLKKGTLRHETKLSHFEKIVEKVTYKMGGGMAKSDLIEAHVIDHYLPFLPLEKSHVEKCAEAEFKRWGFQSAKDKIDVIVKETISYDPNHGFFSVFGCKGIAPKVSLAVHGRF